LEAVLLEASRAVIIEISVAEAVAAEGKSSDP
jgi:hypothetical protein